MSWAERWKETVVSSLTALGNKVGALSLIHI